MAYSGGEGLKEGNLDYLLLNRIARICVGSLLLGADEKGIRSLISNINQYSEIRQFALRQDQAVYSIEKVSSRLELDSGSN